MAYIFRGESTRGGSRYVPEVGELGTSPIGAVVDRITGLPRRAPKGRGGLAEAGTKLVHSAEMQGAMFLSSLAEGYLGRERLIVDCVDVRASVGSIAVGFALFEAMTGRAGSAHTLAIGNGLVGSWLASAGVNLGRSLA